MRKQPQEGFGKATVGTEGMVQFTNIQSYSIDFSPSRQKPKHLSAMEWATRGSFIQQRSLTLAMNISQIWKRTYSLALWHKV